MSRRSVAITYLGFTALLLGLGLWIARDLPSALRAKAGAAKDSPARRRPSAEVALPLLPYDPSGRDLLVVAEAPPLVPGWAPRPVFWMRADRLCVMQKPLAGRRFKYEKALPTKTRFEDLLLRLAALRGKASSASADLHITFFPMKGEPFEAATSFVVLNRILELTLPVDSRRPHIVTRAAIRATTVSEAPPGLETRPWSLPRIPLASLRQGESVPLQEPERIRKAAKRLPQPCLVPTPRGLLLVALFPVVQP